MDKKKRRVSLAVSRPALRYYGGKFRLASWIIQHFSEHSCYCEPYGGAMSVLLQKPLADLEVYNDLDDLVVNFFRVLRKRPDDLIRALVLTPYAREEQRQAFEPCNDELEQARRFYVASWQSFGGSTRQSTGWRYQLGKNNRSSSVLDDWNHIDHLQDIIWRLKQVQIEHDEATSVIARFDSPDTLFYVDPPYPLGTRSRGACYRHEMSDEQHQELSQVLHRAKGMIVLSGYPCQFYQSLYPNWLFEDRPSRTNGGGVATERLWLSPNLVHRLNGRQLNLLES